MYELFPEESLDGPFEPSVVGQLGTAAWNDGRTWLENWVYFPASTNVHSARYCVDGSHQMQVRYGGIIQKTRNGYRYDPIRFYNYGPNERLTYDLFLNFLSAPSKGSWSWASLDPRWGSTIRYVPVN